MSIDPSQAKQATKKPWYFSLLKPFQKILKNKVQNFHHELFQWHSETFFPFEQKMSAREKQYLDTCFSLAETFLEVPESGYAEFSYYSYSHRIQGDVVNSSRLAYGSVIHHEKALESALPVIEERNVPLDPYFLKDPQSLFYGLGWDFLANHFKIYFRVLDLDQLPQASFQALLEETLPNRRSEGLVSFTFIDQELHEQKVYVYPNLEVGKYDDIFPGTKGRVLMSTSKRGTITQYDVSETKRWSGRVNPRGIQVLKAYAQKGYALDTIALKDKDNFTIYFPGELSPFAIKI